MVRLLKERFANHQPLFTMVCVESLPLEDNNVEVEAVAFLG
jgi:enamine deaminase RidA (YjgF/YER057c/UK114 family)